MEACGLEAGRLRGLDWIVAMAGRLRGLDWVVIVAKRDRWNGVDCPVVSHARPSERSADNRSLNQSQPPLSPGCGLDYKPAKKTFSAWLGYFFCFCF